MRAALRALGFALGALIVVVLALLGLAQTRTGQDWLAGAVARAADRPDFSIAIEGLGGTVPLQMTARRVEIGDEGGVWLILRDLRLDLAPLDLLAGRVRIRLLQAAEVEIVRAPSSRPEPLAERLRLPHLPVAIAVERLAVARLALARPVLGEAIAATLAGNAEAAGGTMRAALDLHRIDGIPGNIELRMASTGAPPVLSLRLSASEPTGVVLDRVLGRTDHLPLTLSLDGTGPVSDWHGRLAAAAGAQARLDADLALAATAETTLGLSAKAALAPLLPADLAAVLGDRVALSLHAVFGDRTTLDRLSLETAAGTVAGDAAWGGADGRLAAHLRAALPDLSDLAKLAGIGGAPPHGSATLSAELSGSENHPTLDADLTASAVRAFAWRADRIAAHLSATALGPLDRPETRIAAAANGRVEGLAAPAGGPAASSLGRGIDWSAAATFDRAAAAVELTRFSLRGAGLDLAGSGHLATGGRTLAGNVDFTGSATALRTGIAAVDALLGDRAEIAGAAGRDEAGVVTLDRLALNSAAATLSGNARFDPATQNLAAAMSLDVPQLAPLGAALGAKIAGSVATRIKAEGPLARLRLESTLAGRGIAAGGTAIDQLQLSGVVADLSRPQAVIDGSYRAFGLDGRLALTAAPNGSSELMISSLRLSAADSTVEGNLRIALATGLVQGSLTGRLPDLTRWSALAGTPLGGSLDVTAGFAAQGGGQGLNVSLSGARLAVGAGAGRSEIGRLGLTARLADIRRAPSGSARLSLAAARFGPAEFTGASLAVDSARPGRFAFQGNADGHPLSLAFAGEGGPAPGGVELRLTRLTGSLGDDRIALQQPLGLTRRGADLALSGLDLRLGPGRVTGRGAINGEALSLTLNAVDLPVSSGARLIGYPGVHGDLSLAATLGGTLRAPQGHIALNARELSLGASRHQQGPRLGLTVAGDWNGRAIAVTGRVTGLSGDRMSLSGSLPLLLTRAPLGLSVPADGRLALQLQGSGDIGHLADLLPLGEDRVSGKFTADAAVGGTVAAPAASGQLRLTGARYENFASGAVLTDLAADVIGDRDRFRLASLSAGDGAGGSVKAEGSLVLRGADGPTAQLSAALTKFRIAARDEAVATASGTISVTGPLAAPRVTAPLTIDHAEINLPNSLPPSVVVLDVTEINGRRRPRAPLAAAPAPTVTTAALDITLRMPGRVVVRGHGLDSNWHGRLEITGTSAAPQIAGSLAANRGSFDVLGKSFRLTRGTITFDGTARIDPALDIIAEATAADITAQVVIGGFASAPTITLASTPPLPKDEILARVLFNRGVGQMTAGEGLQLAQAAATLAGGGPGMLDRLRAGLGLDWLRFGQGPAGAASSILNPRVVSPSTAPATAVSAGKYIAPGVSVGVTQGVSPPTSRVTVEIELGRHLTIDTEAGQNGGTGIGLNYNYDY